MTDNIISSGQVKPLPFPVRSFNSLAGGVQKWHSKPIKADQLMKRAIRSSRLSDFGPMDFVEPLEQLVESLNSEANLHPFGKFVAQQRLVNLLNNRLRAVKWWTQHPEILQETIPPPLLIAGMQRTGTTLLHRLLALDERIRSLKSWEALNPAPFDKGDPDKRIKEAKTSEKAVKYLAPDFFAIHPIQHLSPEEDVLLLDISLRSTVAEATTSVPGFARWLEEQDQRPAYAFMKQLLQLLQWTGPRGRWVLKSPHHLEWLDVVEDVFPGTQYLQTHRHPAAIVPSLCSMIFHGRVMFSSQNDPKVVGEQWITKMERLLSRSMAFRENHNAQFLDIDYHLLVSDPLPTMERVYDFLKMPLDDVQLKKIEDFLKSHGQHRFGRHKYEIKDFTDEDIMKRPVFKEYVDRFQLEKKG